MIFLKFIVFTTTLIIFSNDCNLYANLLDTSETTLLETNRYAEFIVGEDDTFIKNPNQEIPSSDEKASGASGKKDSGK
jgi:hypothetical protein